MLEIFLTEFPELGFGYDLKITDENATLGDYLKALDEFQDKYVTACRGCDGCCWERVPLGIVDYFWGQALFPEPAGLLAWLNQVAELQEVGGAVDFFLKRGDDSACNFLDKEKKECKNHLARPLVCRTHICLPKSGLALALRSTIVNTLEDELARRVLLEFCGTTIDFSKAWREILTKSDIADYAANAFSSFDLEELKNRWQNVRLKDLVSVELWQELCSAK